MLFNSLHFAVFFPLVLVLYFLTPHRYRWVLMLTASYYFYMSWKVEYLFLILFSTLVDYFAANMIGKTQQPSKRRLYLYLCVAVNLIFLFSFKYFNFVNDSLRAICNEFNIFYDVPAVHLLLPVGISFYTFQSLAYIFDVYRGKVEPERHLGYYAVYVAFFPQLVAGPIERAWHMMPQHHREHHFDLHVALDGLYIMLWGYFKKLVIADRLAAYVSEVYSNPANYHGWTIILATYLFSFQVYCDFSGYTDIATGTGQVMGYQLLENFRRPYFGHTIADFWRRWHISLTSWFRDYLYIPLGGNRVSHFRKQMNVVIVFLVSGLWHGASWTFVIWGGLHGLYYLISDWSAELRARVVSFLRLDKVPRLHYIIQVFITFNLVSFSWFFFRSASMHDTKTLLVNVLQFSRTNSLYAGMTPRDFVVGIIAVIFLFFVEKTAAEPQWNPHPPLYRCLYAERSRVFQAGFYYALALSILVLATFGSNPFIYFQF